MDEADDFERPNPRMVKLEEVEEAKEEEKGIELSPHSPPKADGGRGNVHSNEVEGDKLYLVEARFELNKPDQPLLRDEGDEDVDEFVGEERRGERDAETTGDVGGVRARPSSRGPGVGIVLISSEGVAEYANALSIFFLSLSLSFLLQKASPDKMRAPGLRVPNALEICTKVARGASRIDQRCSRRVETAG